jgi:hypothetical protein
MVEQIHHPAFPQHANPDTVIWRYLTPNKFEWMVNEGRLFMPNAAHLGDPLEGTQPAGDSNWWRSLASLAASEDERRTVEYNCDLISRFAVAFRTRYYVSCWHINEVVNHDMWKLYADSPESVAIRSTVAKLRAALPDYVDIGMIRYIDYDVDRLPSLNMLEYVTHKNKFFERERELRAVAMHPVVEGLAQQHFRTHHFQADNNSCRVFAPPIDVSALVDSIFIHPDAPEFFLKTMCSLCEKHGLPIPPRAVWK